MTKNGSQFLLRLKIYYQNCLKVSLKIEFHYRKLYHILGLLNFFTPQNKAIRIINHKFSSIRREEIMELFNHDNYLITDLLYVYVMYIVCLSVYFNIFVL